MTVSRVQWVSLCSVCFGFLAPDVASFMVRGQVLTSFLWTAVYMYPFLFAKRNICFAGGRGSTGEAQRCLSPRALLDSIMIHRDTVGLWVALGMPWGRGGRWA